MEPQELSPLRIAFLASSLLCLSLSWTFGCTRDDDDGRDVRRSKADATARLAAAPGTTGHGFVRFVQEDDGVHVIAELAGMPPGDHGFHVHETGDCTPPDFTSAGEHFAGAPTKDRPLLGKRHGFPTNDERHAGDLGNILVAEDGTASVDRFDQVIALDGDRSIIGRALIVHANADNGHDVKSSGARMLCGVVERANLVGERRSERKVPSVGDDAVDPTLPGDHAIPTPTPPITIP